MDLITFRIINEMKVHFFVFNLIKRMRYLLFDTQDLLDSQVLSSDVRDEMFKELMFPLQHCPWMWHSSVCLFLSFILAFVLWVTDRI